MESILVTHRTITVPMTVTVTGTETGNSSNPLITCCHVTATSYLPSFSW